MQSTSKAAIEDHHFLELRRKVREAEVLSASMERLLQAVRFSGRLTVVVQNGRVLKSGYEEGLFRRHAQPHPFSGSPMTEQ